MINSTDPNTPVLFQRDKITILLDTQAFDESLERGDRTALALACLSHSDLRGSLFDLMRTPGETNFPELNYIGICRSSSHEVLFVTANCAPRSTTQQKLAFCESPACVMSVEEASQFIDLFLKHKGHCAASFRSFTKREGHWYSMRSKLPHLSVSNLHEESYLLAMGVKVMYALMATDEIGAQYYLGPTDDTATVSRYHFHYLISLLSGCFDNIALATNERLDIGLKPSACSLVPRRGFINRLRNCRSTLIDVLALTNHMEKYKGLTELVHNMRDIVVHREGFLEMNLGKGGATAVLVGEDIVRDIRNCSLLCAEPKELSAWGVLSSTNIWIEPFCFSRELMTLLCEFVDGYLAILGNPPQDRADGPHWQEDPTNRKIYKQFHLGF